MEKHTNKFGCIVPIKSTKSYQHYSSELLNSEMMIVLLNIGSAYIDDNQEEVVEILKDAYHDPNNIVSIRAVEYLDSEDSKSLLDIETYSIYYGQMCFARSMDNAMTYFKEILAEVIRKEPRILKSNEMEKLDFILNYNSMDGLIIALAEKKIEALFYGNIEEISKFFLDKLKILLFKTEEEKKKFNRYVKWRNLIVHNRGLINSEFVKQFPEAKEKLGYYLNFKYDDLSKYNVELNNFIVHIDFEISKKFDLTLYDHFPEEEK